MEVFFYTMLDHDCDGLEQAMVISWCSPTQSARVRVSKKTDTVITYYLMEDQAEDEILLLTYLFREENDEIYKGKKQGRTVISNSDCNFFPYVLFNIITVFGVDTRFVRNGIAPNHFDSFFTALNYIDSIMNDGFVVRVAQMLLEKEP